MTLQQLAADVLSDKAPKKAKIDLWDGQTAGRVVKAQFR